MKTYTYFRIVKTFILLIILFPITASANIDGLRVEGNTIVWPDTGGWMEVQDGIQFETVEGCVGFITSCRVPNGLYQVIDHSAMTRQEQVRIPNESDTLSPINVVQGCGFGRGATAPLRCDLSCPASSELIAVVGCVAAWGAGADREVTPVFTEPQIFNGGKVWDGARCEAITDSARLASEYMNMKISINCTR
ncbi:MAG: hypothetical protein AB8B63_14320 [Granulosicoccus sp.]